MIQACSREDWGNRFAQIHFGQLVPAGLTVWHRCVVRSEAPPERRQAPSFQPIGVDGYFEVDSCPWYG
jgi:hypothetical protein